MILLKKAFKNSIFIMLWVLIIFNAIDAALELSEIMDIDIEVLSRLLLIRSTLFFIYIIFTFLFRKTMSKFFLIINTILWFYMSLPSIANLGLEYRNIVIFERITLIFNAFMLIYIYVLYIKTFHCIEPSVAPIIIQEVRLKEYSDK